MANKLFSFQGRFSTIKRKDNGALDLASKTWLGNVEEATLEISVDKEEKKESFSGQRAIYGNIITGKTVTLNMTLDEFIPEVLALSLYGKQITTPLKDVKDEVFPDDVKQGEILSLDGLFISDLVITDSNATAKILVEGTDYEISSKTAGDIKFFDVSGFTQPFKASYKTADTTSLAIFSEVEAPERFLVFEGVDTLNGQQVYMELYRVQFEPTSSFGLINESFGTLPLNATLLVDSERMDDTALGGFGRIITSGKKAAVNNNNTTVTTMAAPLKTKVK